MIQKNYIGDLEPRLMEHYRKLVRQEIYDICGSDSRILFSDKANHVIKYPIYNVKSINETGLEREYFIGIDLMARGVNVPQMYAIDVGQKNKKPFVVMEKLDFIKMNLYQEIQAKTQFDKQIQMAKDLGYYTIDADFYYNSGWDKKKNALYLYDFECWRGPRVDEIMKESSK